MFERIAKLPPRHFLRRVAERTDLSTNLKSIFCTSAYSKFKHVLGYYALLQKTIMLK